jgi:hypothetical protein
MSSFWDMLGKNPYLDPRAMAGGKLPNHQSDPKMMSAAAQFVPGVGDAIGLLSDAAGYIQNPQSLTPASGLLSLAALAPGIPRKLPLTEWSHPFSKYRNNLPEGSLFRETNGSRFRELFGGSSPFGNPRWHFAESADMALGQGNNKGLLFKIDAQGLRGKAELNKPGLDQAFLNQMGEFTVDAQPHELTKRLQEVWVTPEAYQGLQKWEKTVLDRNLAGLEKQGIKVNRVDALPGR